MDRIIYHVDVNSAFLSWEAVYRIHHLGMKKDLRMIPSAVGGDKEKRHGIILAKSIPAGKYGVRTGEPVTDARKKCPKLLLVPPNYRLYQRSSRALFQILSQYTDRIERYSIDEAFMDMTGCTARPVETAYKLKQEVTEKLGFTVNIGVAGNKLLAKMASDFQKPDQVHTLWPNEIERKLWPLSVGELFYVGPATRKKLEGLGIHTIGQLAAAPEHSLKAHFKSHGSLIRQYANGLDSSEVISLPPSNKGYGNSLTTPKDVCDGELARLYLLSLAETLSARLRADRVKIGVVAVSIRDYNLVFTSRQVTLSNPTDLTSEIYQAACICFEQLWKGLPIRHLGIHTNQVTTEAGRQMGLFQSLDYDKQKKAETAVDELRKRFGIDCVKRASFLGSPANKEGLWIDHMGGGISREKWTVDYNRELAVSPQKSVWAD